MNRQQRRAASRRKGQARYTEPEPVSAPVAKVQYLDADGNVIRTEFVNAEPAPDTGERDRAEIARRRVSAHVMGLWLPGDSL